MLKISILGAGSFGCAMACVCHSLGHSVTVWSYSADEAHEIQKNQENRKYLPGIEISPQIHITSDIREVFDSHLILIVVPSFAVVSTVKLLQENVSKHCVIVCLSKGLDHTSLSFFSDVIKQFLPQNEYAILCGPSHAEEIARDVTTALIVSSESVSTSKYIQDVLSTQYIRIYVNNDLVGVQIGAALKNIVALAVGICDGMALGDNTKAALMTRGLKEICELGVKMGANKETFCGLSGIGDLIVTCTSLHSRNRRAGILIGGGMKAQEAIKQVGMTVEGYVCAECAHKLCERYSIRLPIMNEVYDILYKDKSPEKALKNLLSRPFKFETDSNI